MNKPLTALSIISFFLLAAMMLFTTPSGVGPLGVFAFFVLCYMLFLGLAVDFCGLFFRLRSRFDKRQKGGEEKKARRYGAVIAMAPIVILMLRSARWPIVAALIAVALAEIIVCFLISHNHSA